MITIKKYPFRAAAQFELELPRPAKFISAQFGMAPCLFFVVDDQAPVYPVKFVLSREGDDMTWMNDAGDDWNYLASGSFAHYSDSASHLFACSPQALRIEPNDHVEEEGDDAANG